jgi:hypothetical protein
MILQTTTDHLEYLTDEQRTFVRMAFSMPGVMATGWEVIPTWVAGVHEVAPGTGKLWICPILEIGPNEWADMKEFWEQIKNDGKWNRIQTFIELNEMGNRNRRMAMKLGLSLESTLKRFYNNQDVQMYAWVR